MSEVFEDQQSNKCLGFQRSVILLLCVFTATNADISLISLGTKNAADDDGYIYNKPSIPFELPPKEVKYIFEQLQKLV